MAVSTARIRKTLDVQPTRDDKGLVLTIKVRAYDSGLITVEPDPVNDGVAADGSGHDPGAGMLLAYARIGQFLGEFHAQARKRRAERKGQ